MVLLSLEKNIHKRIAIMPNTYLLMVSNSGVHRNPIVCEIGLMSEDRRIIQQKFVMHWAFR